MTRTPLSRSKGQGHRAALVGCTGRPTWTYSNGDLSICVHDIYRVATCRPGWGHIVAVKKDIITSVRLSRHSNISSRWCCREIIVNKGFLLLLTIISRQRHLLPILLCLESLTLVIISFLPISINNQSIAIILSTVILLSWRPPAYSLSWGALSY